MIGLVGALIREVVVVFDYGRKLFVFMTLILTGSAMVSTALAQVDYSGVWTLTTVTTLPDETLPCNYEGTAVITQVGTALSGQAELTLTSGPGACPSEMSAQVTGVVNGTEVELGLLLGGQFGEATFTSVSRPLVNASSEAHISAQSGGPVAKPEAVNLNGPFNVTKGAFAGQGGNWNAVFKAGFSIAIIPTLAYYGALIFGILLLAIGGFRLRRRHII